MPVKPFLSGLTLVAFYLNAAQDQGKGGLVSFADIYGGLERGTLLAELDAKLPNTFDFRLFPPNSLAEQGLIARLRVAAAPLRGQERRKTGVENSGLALLLAFVLEVIQQGEWSQA